MPDQRLFLFRTSHTGVFGTKEANNLEEINQLLRTGWHVVSMSPTSSPSTHVGTIADVYALVLLERAAT